MLSQSGELTLTGSILPEGSSHIGGVISVFFRDYKMTVEAAGISSSIVLDFFMKTIGSSNLSSSRIEAFPIGVDEKYKSALLCRTLLLNCLTHYYAHLWNTSFSESFPLDNWSKIDSRLKPFNSVSSIWNKNIPLRNFFERRQALVEIDVITSLALGLQLEELEMIYSIQFPVLQQNEEDTWYDQKGNIVFTCSKGLIGVGVDRPVWESIRNQKDGESYTHTIDPAKSELYGGQQVTYYAPYTKCDRIEDYRRAWAHFEKVFKDK